MILTRPVLVRAWLGARPMRCAASATSECTPNGKCEPREIVEGDGLIASFGACALP